MGLLSKEIVLADHEKRFLAINTLEIDNAEYMIQQTSGWTLVRILSIAEELRNAKRIFEENLKIRNGFSRYAQIDFSDGLAVIYN